MVVELVELRGARELEVWAKRYLEEGSPELFEAQVVALQGQTAPFRLFIELPEAGRYALHLVGRPGSAVVTRCYEVSGVEVDRGVELVQLPPELDPDGDGFPEDLAAYCALLGDEECDLSCHDPAYRALLDCNPPDGFVADPSCPEPPAHDEFHPFVVDACSDCFNQDCFGGDEPCDDADGDGYQSNVDCDEADPEVNPAAAEGCSRDDPSECPGCEDLIDNDCDGRVNEGCFPSDMDADGVEAPLDCDDCDSSVGPDFVEACGNGVDEDCSAGDLPCDPEDRDRDGHVAAPAGDDCDDADSRRGPGAADFCGDGEAQDCVADVPCIDDVDGDRFTAAFDCDDGLDWVNPWAEEDCDPDGVDEDCDGIVNEVGDRTRGCGRDGETGRWRSIDLLTDLDHCGGCRHRCEGTGWREGEACVEGRCLCGGGEPCEGSLTAYCCVADEGGPGCFDLTADPASCGRCGHRCRPGELCVAPSPGERGVCTCPFEEGGQACPEDPCFACCEGLGCINVCDDLHHCGGCETDCTTGPAGTDCFAGECQCGAEGEPCASPEWCTDATEERGCGCRDLDSDLASCGECDLACDPGEICEGGSCRCPGGGDCRGDEEDTCCPGAGCVDLSGDSEHCGRCGEACGPGEICREGACRCSADCDDGQLCTEGECAGGRCVQRTRDEDDDGYCREGCPDIETGEVGECLDSDCDDDRASQNPGARETCATAFDDDCDGSANDDSALGCELYFYDEDRDDFGAEGVTPRCLCEPEGRYRAPEASDCDDDDPARYPGAVERCNGLDDDCNPSTEDGAGDCPGRCCGPGPVCQECCGDPDCPGVACEGFQCTCAPDASDCAGICDCSTGGGEVCCDAVCYGGDCCQSSDCPGGQNCVDHLCS